MARPNNSTNSFATTRYLVSKVGSGSYSTIQAAVNDASTSGGGTVYVQNGVYTENISFKDNVTITGANGFPTNSGGSSSVGFYNAEIVGSHTFPTSANGISIKNLFFTGASSGSTDLFTLAPSTGVMNVDFSDCTINASFNLSTGKPFNVSSTASGSVRLVLTNCFILGAATSTVGANSTVVNNYSSLTSTVGATISLLSATASVTSNCSSYTTTGTAAVAPTVSFTANGLFTSYYDNFTSSNTATYYVQSSGAFGRFAYAYASISGTATLIDPQITQTILLENPNIVPTTNGQIIIGSTGQIPVTSTLTAGTGISVTNGAGSISIAAVSPGGTYLTWQSITSNTTLAVNNGYIVSSGALSLALPSTATLGSVIVIALTAGTSWTVTQAAGQSIRVSNLTTTTGASGTMSSSASGDSVMMVCTTANTTWTAYAVQGNLSLI
jgi:hypothetical protein